MTDLASVLAAPPKKRAVVDPNVKIIRRLARLGWNGYTYRGNDKTVIVRRHGDEVWLTDTYGLRRWRGDEDVAVALLSMLPESDAANGVADTGFALRILGSRDPEYLGPQTVDMAKVMPSRDDIDSGRFSIVTDWRADPDDGDIVIATAMDGQEARLMRKRLAMVTDGVEPVSAWIESDRKPVAFTSSWFAPFAVLMPLLK